MHFSSKKCNVYIINQWFFNALYFFYENKNLTLPMTRPNISFIYSLSLQIRPDFAGFESNILHLGHWIGKYQTFKNNIPDHFVMWKFWYIVRNIWNIRVKLFDVNINSLHMYVRALKWSVAMKPHVMHCPLKLL